MKSSTNLVKRLLSFIMAVLMVVSVPSFIAMAAQGDSAIDPLTDISDKINFPDYPGQGSVGISKSARWVVGPNGEENKWAQVTLNVESVPTANGADVVLILDNSGSMGTSYSQCMNESHYTNVVWKANFTYQVQTAAGWQSTEFTDELTFTGRTHVAGGITAVTQMVISGYRTEYNGSPVLQWRYDSTTSWDESGWTLKAKYTKTLLDNRIYNLLRGTASVSPSTSYTFPTLTSYFLPQALGSSSYGCTAKIDIARDAGHLFVEEMFKKITYVNSSGQTITIDNDFRVGCVAFNASATSLGGGLLYTANQENSLKSAITTAMTAGGGTSYYSALTAATNILNNRSTADKANRPAYIVFMSDGKPEGTGEDYDSYGNHTTLVQGAIDRAKAACSEIYAIGIGLDTVLSPAGAAYNSMRAVAKPVDNTVLLDTGEISSLTPTFQVIARKLVYSGTNATIRDVMGDYFTLMPNSAQWPWEIKLEGTDAPMINVSSSGDVLTWELGNIPAQVTLTYYVQIADGAAPNQLYDTNEVATITYKNTLDKWCRQTFGVPQLPLPGGSINVVRYLTNASGYPVSRDGSTLQNESYSTIKATGSILFDDYLRVNGIASLPINATYPSADSYLGSSVYPSTGEASFIVNGTYYELTKLRLMDPQDNYSTQSTANWSIRLSTYHDDWRLLSGFQPKLRAVVTYTVDGVVQPEESIFYNVNDAVSVTPKVITNASLQSASYEVHDIYGATLTGHNITMDQNSLNSTFGNVTGTMPYGNIFINYDFRTTSGLLWTVEYYPGTRAENLPMYKSDTGTGNYNDPIPYSNAAANVPPGYSNVITDTYGPTLIGYNGAENVLKVYFGNKGTYNYTVYYCRGTKNDIASTVSGSGTYQTTIPVNIAVNTPAGYSGAAGDYYYDPSSAADAATRLITEDSAQNIVYVVFTNRLLYDYTVYYYTDEATAANRYDTVTGTGFLGAQIPVDLNSPPTGYNSPGIQTGATHITVNSANNIAHVVYSNKVVYPVTFNYYKDSVSDANRYDVKQVNMNYNDLITVDLYANAAPGYVGPAAVEWVTSPVDHRVIAGANTVNVIFTAKDDNVRYTIFYCQDTTSNVYRSVPGTGTYGDNIVINVADNTPPGYSNASGDYYVTPANPTIKADPTENNVFVVFTKKASYGYTVYYYTDDLTGTPYDTVTGTGAYGSLIPVDLYSPPTGYTAPGVQSGERYITDDPSLNVAYVLYSNKGECQYVINYYRDSVADANRYDMRTGSGLYGETIVIDPYDNPPAGYNGPADVQRSNPTLVTGTNTINVIFTEKKTDIAWTVYYCKDSKADTSRTAIAGTGTLGADIPVDVVANAPAGYSTATGNYYIDPSNAADRVIKADSKDNVVYVVYTVKDAYDYTVNYYKDSVATVNLWKSVSDSAYLGEIIPRDLNTPPAGYLAPGVVDSGPDRVTSNSANNVVNVVFKNKATYPVTIYYYKDSATGTPWDTKIIYLEYGSTIVVDPSDNVPPGYSAPGVVDYVTGNIVVETGNTVTVVFSNKADYLYTVNYYVYGASSSQATLMRSDSDYGPYGAAIQIDTTYRPTGYTGDGTRTGATTISDDPSKNIVNVYWSASQRIQYQYEIQYHKDLVTNTAFKTVSGILYINDLFPVDVEGNLPAGYLLSGAVITSANTAIDVNNPIIVATGSNVIHVTYADRQSGIAFEVRYYKDFLGDENNYLGSADGTGTFGASIVANLTLYCPTGYNSPGTQSGASTIGADPIKNVAYVLYSQKATVAYTIEYYKDNTNASNLIDAATVYGSGYYGSLIPINLYHMVPDGYAGPGTNLGAVTIGLTAADNVAKVVYTIKRTDIRYTVKYYIDTLDESNLRGTVTGYGSVDDPITPDLTVYCPAGYGSPTVSGANYITTNPDNNVTKVLYVKQSLTVTMNYFKDSMANPIGSVPLTGMQVGDTIVADHATYLPRGYSLPAEWYGPYTVQASNTANIVNIVYTLKNAYEYRINYYKVDPSTNDRVFIGYVGGTAYYGSQVYIDASKYAPDGYKTPGTIEGGSNPIIISDVVADNIVSVIYGNDPDDIIKYAYTITYYKDSINSGNQIGAVAAGEGYLGENLYAKLENRAPAGYLSPGKWYGPTTVQQVNNDVIVVYDTKLTYQYTVEYYTDTTPPTLIAYETFYDVLGAPIVPNTNKYVPTGYYGPGRTEPVTPPYPTVTENAGDNVIKVYYAATSASYSIFWYKDGVGGELLNSESGSAPIGTILSVGRDQIIDNYAYAPDGYQVPGQIQGSPVVYAGYNVINIIYAYRNIYDYKISYYKGSIDSANLVAFKSDRGSYGDPIIFDKDAYRPSGQIYGPGVIYKNGVPYSGSMIISNDTTENEYAVVYPIIQDNVDIGYTVLYYKDYIDSMDYNNSVNYIDQATGLANLGDRIPYDALLHLPTGYNPTYIVSGPTYMSNLAANNVVYVVYTSPIYYSYTVVYWKDNMNTASNRVGSVSGTGAYDSLIPITDAYCPQGYDASNYWVDRDPAVISSGSNVINVIFYRQTYGWSIEYYLDAYHQDNLYLTVVGDGVGTNPAKLPYGTILTHDDSVAPDGYGAGQALNYVTIGYIEQYNVLRVLFTKRTNLKVTVNYYYDDTAGTPYKTESLYGTLGDAIVSNLDPTAPNQLRVDVNKWLDRGGYENGIIAGGSAAVISAVEADNVVNVLYTKKGDIAYKIIYKTADGDELGVENGSGTLGDPIVPGHIYDIPDGFTMDGFDYDGPTTIQANADDNVVTITYEHTAATEYTIMYYKAGQVNAAGDGVTGAQYIGDATVSSYVGIKITLDYDTLNVWYGALGGANPDFYKKGKQLGTVPYVLTASGNTIIVHYATISAAQINVYYYRTTNPDGTGPYSSLGNYSGGAYSNSARTEFYEVGETCDDTILYALDPDDVLGNITLISYTPQVLQFSSNSAQNVVNFYYYYESIGRSLGTVNLLEIGEYVDSATEVEIDMAEEVDLNDFVVDSGLGATVTIVSIPEDKSFDLSMIPDYEDNEIIVNVNDLSDKLGDIADIVEGIYNDAEVELAYVEVIDADDLDSYVFLPGLEYTIIVNYGDARPISDIIGSESGSGETAVINNNAERVNESVKLGLDELFANSGAVRGETEGRGRQQENDTEPEPDGSADSGDSLEG